MLVPARGETALNMWLEGETLSNLDAKSSREDRIGELDEESKKNLGAVFSNCLSDRQRQVYYLHHGIISKHRRPMAHHVIAKKLGLTEAEVDEIFYHAEMAIRTLRDNLEDRQTSAHRALHIWLTN